MSRLSSFFSGMVCGAVGILIAMNYYVVRSKESVHLVPKVAAKLEMPYYDIRNYSLEDWQRHPSLAAALVSSKDNKLMENNGVESVSTRVEGLLREWTNGF
ncbi:MAG: hypothetical protein ACTHK7_04345 [Aureliella sp.]